MIRLVLISAFVPFLMGSVLQGVTASGIHTGTESAVPDWSTCSSVVAYWDLDETGVSDRLADAGSCGSDCTTSAETGVDATTGVRGNGVRITAPSEYLSCADATCDELDFVAQDFSLSGWITFPNPSIIGATEYALLLDNYDGSSGYETRHRAFLLFVALGLNDGFVDTETAHVSDVRPSDTQINFFSLSWDESANALTVCSADRNVFRTFSVRRKRERSRCRPLPRRSNSARRAPLIRSFATRCRYSRLRCRAPISVGSVRAGSTAVIARESVVGLRTPDST